MSICLSLFLTVCEINQPISLKLGVVIGPTNRKNFVTFGGDLVPDRDFGTLYHFPPYCGIGDFFYRFILLYALDVCNFDKRSMQSLDFTFNRFFYEHQIWKLCITVKDCSTVIYQAHY